MLLPFGLAGELWWLAGVESAYARVCLVQWRA